MFEVGSIFYDGEEFCLGFFNDDSELIRQIKKKRAEVEAVTDLSAAEEEEKEEVLEKLDELFNDALFEEFDAIIN